ncbi:hypothetical protein SDRG_01629 [Saprolegnia diclina VS20]|uniref:Uncharacterized protein n=1 Tax=Saprolegnia diclina (strain VS20) TaxID=1156394 RepID=T0R3X7_SAPDV|nr:hypothetical protein SDRG_01629 [Saprolegnia diclina VS20]EQC41671.1 hypothetical protein SDRG_01629 [Saprolegnia diclina VS20]|eukprot:XP_008605385.1 hypothetical protein SDRG_01629 [Saprolegnia diclina VS20]
MERFFSHRQDGEDCSNIEVDVGMGSSDMSLLLLHGPSRSGKSSLALQYAFELVKRGGTDPSVVLVSHASTKANNRMRLVRVAPCESCHTPAESGQDSIVWSRIRLKYLESAAQLRHFVCSFHMLEGKNTALIIDDLDLFCTSPTEIYRTLAFIKETIEFMRAKFDAGQALVLGSSSLLPRDLRRTLRRWFDLVLQISPGDNDAFVIQEEMWPSTTGDDWAELVPLFPRSYCVEYTFVPNSDDAQGYLQFTRASLRR